MDGERKKRRMENMENDEEKMESFFALIKNIRDIRQSMMKGRDQSNKKDSVEPIDDKPLPSPVVTWNPSFQPEDFMDDPQQMPLNYTAQLPSGGPSKREKEEEPQDEDRGYDQRKQRRGIRNEHGCAVVGETEDAESSYIDWDRVSELTGPSCKPACVETCWNFCLCIDCGAVAKSYPICFLCRCSSIQALLCYALLVKTAPPDTPVATENP